MKITMSAVVSYLLANGFRPNAFDGLVALMKRPATAAERSAHKRLLARHATSRDPSRSVTNHIHAAGNPSGSPAAHGSHCPNDYQPTNTLCALAAEIGYTERMLPDVTRRFVIHYTNVQVEPRPCWDTAYEGWLRNDITKRNAGLTKAWMANRGLRQELRETKSRRSGRRKKRMNSTDKITRVEWLPEGTPEFRAEMKRADRNTTINKETGERGIWLTKKGG